MNNKIPVLVAIKLLSLLLSSSSDKYQPKMES